MRRFVHVRNRYLAAAAAGVLLTGAFPKIDVAGFAWVVPGLMVLAALGISGSERWRIGYVAGLAHYLTLLYWLLYIPYRWHGIPFGPALGWLALSGFVALFTATWVWLITAPTRRLWLPGAPLQESSPAAPAHETEIFHNLSSCLPQRWLGRLAWSLFGAASWVAMEMILARIFGGFPWAFLGVTQHTLVPLIQVASVTGVYGVSFLVVWVSLTLLSAGLMVLRRPTQRSVWVGELFIPLLVVASLFGQGLRSLRDQPESAQTLKVLMVQPSIPQTTIWDPSADTGRFQSLVSYTDQVLTNKPDVLIWPESAVPKPLRYDQETYDAITGLARKHGIWMIIGSDDAERRQGISGDASQVAHFNSSFLITPQGRVAQGYRKRSLVIFGEYVPLQRWLPFLKWFTPVTGGFTSGTEPGVFELGSLDVKASVLICFEDIFPQLGRAGVDHETDMLVNLTNDGWFGESAAQWQQAAAASFRAVENSRPLLRCCNNGITCYIDERGRFRNVFRDEKGSEYGSGFLLVDVSTVSPDLAAPLTAYTRLGDVFGWASVAVTGTVLLARVSRGFFRRGRNKP